MLTLNIFFRLLQISSFNGKMNALNEVNKVISSVSYYTHRHNPEEEEWLTAERMAVSFPVLFLTLFLLLFHIQTQFVLLHFVYPILRSGSNRITFCPLCCGTVCISLSMWRNWRRSCALLSKKKPLPCRIWTIFGLHRCSNC